MRHKKIPHINDPHKHTHILQIFMMKAENLNAPLSGMSLFDQYPTYFVLYCTLITVVERHNIIDIVNHAGSFN
jgi:hypothetical protein